MLSIKDIDKLFAKIASDHTMIRSYMMGELSEVDINKLKHDSYPLLAVDVSNAQILVGEIQFTIDILLADFVEGGESQTLDQSSSTLLLFQDVVSELHQMTPGLSGYEFEISHQTRMQLPVNCTAFTARFDNNLTGWGGSLILTASNKNNACDIPN